MWGRWRRARQVMEEARADFEDPAPRRTPSLAQDLLVAVLDPRTGRFHVDNHFDLVVSGAVLLELVQEGRLVVEGSGRKASLEVRERSPLGVPELDDALLTVAAGPFGRRLSRLLRFVPGTVETRQRLVRDGLLLERRHRVLGLVPVRRHTPTPELRQDELLDRLRWALADDGVSDPDPRTVRLAVLLDTGAKLRRVVAKEQRRTAERRVEELHGLLGEQEQLFVTCLREAWSRAQSNG